MLQSFFASCWNFLILLTNCSAMPGFTPPLTINSAATFGCRRMEFSSRNWSIASVFSVLFLEPG